MGAALPRVRVQPAETLAVPPVGSQAAVCAAAFQRTHPGVLWLLSDESSFMTGQALVLDGGWTAI